VELNAQQRAFLFACRDAWQARFMGNSSGMASAMWIASRPGCRARRYCVVARERLNSVARFVSCSRLSGVAVLHHSCIPIEINKFEINVM